VRRLPCIRAADGLVGIAFAAQPARLRPTSALGRLLLALDSGSERPCTPTSSQPAEINTRLHAATFQQS